MSFMESMSQHEPSSFDEKQFLRNLYYDITKEIDQIGENIQRNHHDQYNGYDGETMGRLVRAKLLLIRERLVEFARLKGWLSQMQSDLCTLDNKKRLENGKCVNCS